jgi:nicotinamide-nucleotide amidase
MNTIRTAACLAIGSELLGDRKLDRNSLTVTREIARFGAQVIEKAVVGDDEAQIERRLRDLLERVDLIVTTGGLGPTADDCTRQAVARALDVSLEHDEELEARIRDRYAALDRRMPDVSVVMADVLPGARVLENNRGTAPGFLCDVDGALLVVLPGVPREMEAMLHRDVLPELERRNPGMRRVTRTLLLAGVVESETEERIRPLYDRFGRSQITTLASYGTVRVVLTATDGPDHATGRLDQMEAAFRELLGDDIVAVDQDELAPVVLALLRERGATVATAESCTGGLIGTMLTEVPGSSKVYTGGVISYSNEAKQRFVGVASETLEQHGAVSEEVARAMAEGIRERFGSTWGLGVTGIAGPEGGTEDKPVGLVHFAVAGDAATVHRRHVFPGSRDLIRQWSANSVLDLLIRAAQAEDGRGER